MNDGEKKKQSNPNSRNVCWPPPPRVKQIYTCDEWSKCRKKNKPNSANYMDFNKRFIK